MTAPKQHLILCEGYDDRSFWKGWLTNRGCHDLGSEARDSWGLSAGREEYLFRTPGSTDVRTVSYAKNGTLEKTLKFFLDGHPTKPLGRVILNLDSDAKAGSICNAQAKVDGWIRRFEGQLVNGAFEISGIQVFPIIWTCADPPGSSGIPEKQTLERLASAALCAAYPGRGQAVANWLEAAPLGGTGHKNHSLSYFAKWYAADHGSGFFYEALWKDEAVAAELRSRLEATGAWQIVEDLVAD